MHSDRSSIIPLVLTVGSVVVMIATVVSNMMTGSSGRAPRAPEDTARLNAADRERKARVQRNVQEWETRRRELSSAQMKRDKAASDRRREQTNRAAAEFVKKAADRRKR